MPTPRAVPLGARSARPSDIGARPALAGDYHVVLSRNADGYLLQRSAPPPAFVSAPNLPSLMSALPHELRIATAGPPRALHARIGFSGMAEADIARFATALEQRATAVSGAGGKPPFGGDRRPLAFAEEPRPGRGWGEGQPPRPPEDGMFTKAWDQMMGVVGKRTARVHVIEGDATLLRATPNWSTVEVRTLDPNAVLLFNSPKMPGVSHIIELKMSQSTATGSRKIVTWLKTWYKEKLPFARAEKLNQDISALLKSNAAHDMEAAAARIKSLVKDEYGANDAWFHIDLEGAGSVTVVEATPRASRGRAGRG